ncbi:hypothetical protein [Cupriavidus campinensis]|nr:hypothetical protein [Cupriavidus campinensis]
MSLCVQAHPNEKTSAKFLALLGQEVHTSLGIDEEARESVE